MGLYSDLTDEALAAKIAELRDAIETTAGGQVAVIAGNGRRMEYTRADSKTLWTLLRAATNEKDERAGIAVSGGIGVVYP